MTILTIYYYLKKLLHVACQLHFYKRGILQAFLHVFQWSWDGDTYCMEKETPEGIEKSVGGCFNMKLDPNKNCALSLGMVIH